MDADFEVDLLTREGMQQCSYRIVPIQRPLMKFMIQWLLVSRKAELAYSDGETKSIIYQSIIDEVFENGPVVRLLKLVFFWKNASKEFAEVQVNYEEITKVKLVPLLENICDFSGIGKKDLEEIFKKIVIYIIASNKMFSAKNSKMVAEAKCALNSILTKQDLIDFVSRKKHYRLEYLNSVGKIMCGILLFNKNAGLGGEDIRDVVSDIHAAYQNTLEAMRISISRCNQLIKIGLKSVSNATILNLVDGNVVYRLSESITMEDLMLFNKFIYLHLQHEKYLLQLKELLLGLKINIEANVGQLKEYFLKLHEVVKFRLAIPSELVFPNFTKLFETWYKILMQLYFLVEINRINDAMMEIVSTEYPFEEMALAIGSEQLTETIELKMEPLNTLEEDEERVLRVKRKSEPSVANPLQRFCALTMALTGGILVPADTSFGVLPFQGQFMGFKRKDFGTFAEKNYTYVVKQFLGSAVNNPEMCVLFDIPIDKSSLSPAWKSSKDLQGPTKKKTHDVELQTEHCNPPCNLATRNTSSWNIWDYHRRAIQLANLRKCQTQSSQTNITYSSRDAMVQTYDKTSSTHRCIGSSSPLSKSVCHTLDGRGKAHPSDSPSSKYQPKNKRI